MNEAHVVTADFAQLFEYSTFERVDGWVVNEVDVCRTRVSCECAACSVQVTEREFTASTRSSLKDRKTKL